MGNLILGVVLQYMVSTSISCFLWVLKSLALVFVRRFACYMCTLYSRYPFPPSQLQPLYTL